LSASLLELLRLTSTTLPVGAYSYSQGLESAIDAGIVRDQDSAANWIADCLAHSLARLEAPVMLRLHRAWHAGDATAITHWSEYFLASRDSAEFRAETIQMGYSLRRLLLDMQAGDKAQRAVLAAIPDIPFPAAWSYAAVQGGVDEHTAVLGYLFSWSENQVLAALKAVPLGQVGGQRLMHALAPQIEHAAQVALDIGDDDISNWTPGLSLLSMQHEIQYSRIFRS
jgi:urease accessory protein